MGETPGVFEVADGEFACGVAAVVPVDFDRGRLAVRFPRVVTDLYHRQFGRFGVLFSAAGLVAGVVLSGPGLVAPVGFCRGQVQVGDQRVVSPVGPQLGLGTEQAGDGAPPGEPGVSATVSWGWSSPGLFPPLVPARLRDRQWGSTRLRRYC